MAFVLRWRVCPAGCCCGGFAAGALLGWLCRLGLGRVPCLCFALVRISAGCCCGGFAAGAHLGWLRHWIDTRCGEFRFLSYVSALRRRWIRLHFSPL